MGIYEVGVFDEAFEIFKNLNCNFSTESFVVNRVEFSWVFNPISSTWFLVKRSQILALQTYINHLFYLNYMWGPVYNNDDLSDKKIIPYAKMSAKRIS